MTAWKHWHVQRCTHTCYTNTHTHYKARGGVRLVTVPVSVSVSLGEWGGVPTGDTQPVITKWHKRPTFLSSEHFFLVSASSSEFVYLLLPSSDSVSVSASQCFSRRTSGTLYSNKMQRKRINQGSQYKVSNKSSVETFPLTGTSHTMQFTV